MVLLTRTRIGLGAAGAVLLAASSAVAAGAATSPGWRIVYRHYTPGLYSFYNGVAVWGRSHAWAAGGYGAAGDGLPIVASLRHGRWHVDRMPKATGALFAVSADGPGDAWAGGLGDLLHWHNGKWTLARTWKSPDGGPPAPLVTGITAFSPSNVWVFGGSTLFSGVGTWHLHGRTWTRVKGVGGTVLTASAISPARMWGIGGQGGDAIVRYAGGRWRQVTSPALAGLQFSAIYASSRSGVWVTASPAKGSGAEELLRLQGTRWTAHPLPWPVQFSGTGLVGGGAISPDGHGGFWIPTKSPTGPNWMLHFSRGAWSRVAIGTNPIRAVALIPGTRALWGGGSIQRTRSSVAVVWAYGRAG